MAGPAVERSRRASRDALQITRRDDDANVVAGAAAAYHAMGCYGCRHAALNVEKSPGPCTFCRIVAGTLPSQKVYEDDLFLAFQNRLDWFPVMLLIVPKEHMTQQELWGSGALLARLGRLAVELGAERCPGGFRVLSNFGPDARQTQHHGHLHVIGGAHLGLYVRNPLGL